MNTLKRRLDKLESRDADEVPPNIRRWLGHELTPAECAEADRLDATHSVFSTVRHDGMGGSPEFLAWLLSPGAETAAKAAAFGQIINQVDGLSRGLPSERTSR